MGEIRDGLAVEEDVVGVLVVAAAVDRHNRTSYLLRR